jgi:hypothetical protein
MEVVHHFGFAGYYSYNCSNTGSGNRNYFQIQGNDGVIDVVSTC